MCVYVCIWNDTYAFSVSNLRVVFSFFSADSRSVRSLHVDRMESKLGEPTHVTYKIIYILYSRRKHSEIFIDVSIVEMERWDF